MQWEILSNRIRLVVTWEVWQLWGFIIASQLCNLAKLQSFPHYFTFFGFISFSVICHLLFSPSLRLASLLLPSSHFNAAYILSQACRHLSAYIFPTSSYIVILLLFLFVILIGQLLSWLLSSIIWWIHQKSVFFLALNSTINSSWSMGLSLAQGP